MMTSLLADKSVMVQIKIILNFMNEIINPPGNSMLATFFELNFEASWKRVSSCLKTLVRPKRTLSQLFELLFPLPCWCPRRGSCCTEKRRESCGRSRWPIEESGVCETEASTDADVEEEDEDVDVVGGVEGLGSLGTSLRVSRPLKSFAERDLPRRICPRVSLSPLTFHNVSFQVFNFYNQHFYQIFFAG